MNFLHNYTIRKYIMGFLLLVVLLFGTYAAFSDAIKDALDPGSSSILLDIAPYAGYIAVAAIILYIPLNLLDKRLYEKALEEHKNKERK